MVRSPASRIRSTVPSTSRNASAVASRFDSLQCTSPAAAIRTFAPSVSGGGVPLASFAGDPTSASQVAKFARTFLKQIEPVFPGITQQWNGRATLDVPLTNPFSLGSYSYWKVGQYTLFSGYEKARQPDPTTGKCHFAGEHCSQDFQGYMEGGAAEGARAAGEILDDYKVGIFP